jgi:hypothetical protein
MVIINLNCIMADHSKVYNGVTRGRMIQAKVIKEYLGIERGREMAKVLHLWCVCKLLLQSFETINSISIRSQMLRLERHAFLLRIWLRKYQGNITKW